MKLIADWNPPETTLPREDNAERIPETIFWNADIAACFKFPAIETTKSFSPFQADEAMFFTIDQIFPMVFLRPVNKITTWFTSPCTREPTIWRIPDQIEEAACWIFVHILRASSFSFVKFPVTRSISKRTGPRITFLNSSQAPEAAVWIPCQIPCRVDERFSHKERIISTIPESTGFSIMPVQTLPKKSPTDCHSPDHHAGIWLNMPTSDSQAAGIVSVKKEHIASHAETKNSFTCAQTAFTASRNHSRYLFTLSLYK